MGLSGADLREERENEKGSGGQRKKRKGMEEVGEKRGRGGRRDREEEKGGRRRSQKRHKALRGLHSLHCSGMRLVPVTKKAKCLANAREVLGTAMLSGTVAAHVALQHTLLTMPVCIK